MKRRLTARLLLASLALATVSNGMTGAVYAQGTVRPSQDIVISIGRGELVNVPGAMADVFVANDDVADVQVKSQRQLYVFGKSGGETTVYASNAAGDVIWSANVRVGSNIDSIDQMLALAMPAAKVSVATMGTNTVLLTGTVAAPEDAAEAERLVKAFVGDDANVVTRLKMATPLQVNLQVRIAEVSRNFIRTINTNISSVDGSNGFKFGIGNGRALGNGGFTTTGPLGVVGTGVQVPGGTAIGTTGNSTTLAGMGKFLGLNLIGALDLGETEGLVTTLSNPNLTALSGETAEFLAGGEFPIPTSQGLGATSIEYRKYGVSLAYTPTVLANGRISLRVRPEVSELSNQGAVVMNNFQIPALTVRRAETTVELGSGQSFMIAGLMSNNSLRSIQKVPGAGDIPVLGNLFRSSDFRRGETELVIVVTPYLVNPVNANDIKLPTDGFRASNTAQDLLLMQDNDGVTGGSRPMPTSRNSEVPQQGFSGIDPQATLPGPVEEDSGKKSRKSRKEKRQADASSAAPGFSF
ncbi:MAG: type II and III secretion system protein family protein [Sphingomonadaceae bacterium]